MYSCVGIGSCSKRVATPVQAQEKPIPDYTPKLTQTVHLKLGQTTLAEALAALSNNRHTDRCCRISKDRILFVQMDGLTGRTRSSTP